MTFRRGERSFPTTIGLWLLSGLPLFVCGASSAIADPLWSAIPFLTQRFSHAMAYDSARGRVVLFGGTAVGAVAETWEWDGARWTLRTPPVSPPARSDHAMAYDSARGRVVLFGGTGSAGTLADTWEWDGTQWTLRTPPLSPPATSFHAMAYDSARGRTVLFGTSDGSTWEWDGAQWIKRFSTVLPPARSQHSMAYDSARGRVVLFGGRDLTHSLADTWEWDGTQWLQRLPATSPPARIFSRMAYDSARHAVVLFGGRPSTGVVPDMGDTWLWDGTQWTQQSPAMNPAARHLHGMAYDSAAARVVLFGGVTDTGIGADTWEWDGTNWTQASVPSSPASRASLAMAGDTARGRIVLFGGSGSSGNLSDTWEWDGSLWRQRMPASSPPLRSGHALAYDSARGCTVLFGGANTAAFADTWEWDGAQWLNRAPSASPPARRQHAMAYDEARRVVVLFGGIDGSGTRVGDTWEWDGSLWINRSPPPSKSPAARNAAAMVYDAVRQRVVLFGGEASLGVQLADTWAWDGSQWTQLTPASSPHARAAHSMTFDGARGRTILFGGSYVENNQSIYVNDTWEWDGSLWSQVSSASNPVGRYLSAVAYDAWRGRVVLFGGSPTNGAIAGDTWEYSVACEGAVGRSDYGRLLFPELCAADASGLPQSVFASRTTGVARAAHDSFFLSSESRAFSPLAVEDEVHLDGNDSGLGPYTYQPLVPPFLLGARIERDVLPLPSHEVTSLVSPGASDVLFELVDTDQGIYGNTPVYLVADCGITLSAIAGTIHFMSHDDQVAPRPPEFDIRYGLLSEVRQDRSFGRAQCLGHFLDTPAAAPVANPPVGDGFYFLARGLSSARCAQYGDSSLIPDPRRALDAAPICP